jgi:DNA-binding SARP family transcriptional activator
MSRMIACRTLGPLEVTVDGVMASGDLLWRKPLALLIYLARSGRRGRAREHLSTLFWSEKPDPDARHSLNEALRILRRHAGKDAVETTAGQVRLLPDVVRLDVDELEILARQQNWHAAAALVSGEFLEGFSLPEASGFEDWLAAERGHWRRRAVEVLDHRVEELLKAGDAQQAALVSRRALVLDPRSERSVRAAMRSLALAGDRAAALDAFGEFARRLADELGTAPDAETTALAERVRRQRLARPAPPGAGPADSPVAPRLPLVGRETELSRLLEGAALGMAGRATLLVIEGESGAGKTRLLEEVLARLRLDGATLAEARAVETDADEPWSGALVLARGGLADAPGVAAAPTEALAAFASRLPEWTERFPAALAMMPTPLGRALSEIVRAAAEERPIVLAVDDAQWLDAESAGALAALLRDLASSPLCVALTVSPLPPRPDLDDLRSRIGRDVAGAAVVVEPLTATGLHALAERLLPGYDAVELDRVVRRVGSDSAGLPLLAVELLRAVADGLDLGKLSAAWPEPHKTLDQSLPGDLPDAVVAAVRVGFRRLSADAQRVLAAAAVLDERVTAQRLARATGLPLETVHGALDELEWHHWLVAEPRGYGFVARLVRRLVERDLVTPGQRRRLREADPTHPT